MPWHWQSRRWDAGAGRWRDTCRERATAVGRAQRTTGERGRRVVIHRLSVGGVGSVTWVLTCCAHIWSQWGSEEVCTWLRFICHSAAWVSASTETWRFIRETNSMCYSRMNMWMWNHGCVLISGGQWRLRGTTGGSLVRFPQPACQSVLGQDAEPQNCSCCCLAPCMTAATISVWLYVWITVNLVKRTW